MTKPNIFFIRQKMLRVCAFQNKFSISGPFDLSEWVPDGQVLPGHKIWLSALEDGFFPIFFLRRLSCGVLQLLEGAGWVQLTFGAKTYQHNRYPDIYESIDGLHIAFCLHCPNYKVRIPKQLQEKSEAAMRTLKQSVSKGART